MEKENTIIEEQRLMPKQNPLLVVLIVILILILLPVLGILIFRPNVNISDISGKPTSKESRCSECDKTDCSVTNVKEVNPVTLINQGWMKHILSDAKLSIETPPYSIIQNIGNSSQISKWEVSVFNSKERNYEGSKESKNVPEFSGRLDNYVKTVFVEFYPYKATPQPCGQNCLAEHAVTINIYKNSENLTLEQAWDKFLENFNKEHNEMYGEDVPNDFGSIKTKWNERTYEYQYTAGGYAFNNNLLVKNGYIYEVSYYFSDKYGESLNYAKKVLDSLTFN